MIKAILGIPLFFTIGCSVTTEHKDAPPIRRETSANPETGTAGHDKIYKDCGYAVTEETDRGAVAKLENLLGDTWEHANAFAPTKKENEAGEEYYSKSGFSFDISSKRRDSLEFIYADNWAKNPSDQKVTSSWTYGSLSISTAVTDGDYKDFRLVQFRDVQGSYLPCVATAVMYDSDSERLILAGWTSMSMQNSGQAPQLPKINEYFANKPGQASYQRR